MNEESIVTIVENDVDYASVVCGVFAYSYYLTPEERKRLAVAYALHPGCETISILIGKLSAETLYTTVQQSWSTLLRLFISAFNPKTESLTLEELSYTDNPYLKIAIAFNPQTPQHVLKRYSESDEDSIRYAVLTNPCTSSDIITAMKEWNEPAKITAKTLYLYQM